MEYIKAKDILRCKAKSKDTNEWVYGYVFPINQNEFQIAEILEDGSVKTIQIKPETICCSANMLDYNGNLIYQHDYIERDKANRVTITRVNYEVLMPVRENAWMAGEFKRLTPNSIQKEKIKIVGNSLEE